MGHGARCDGRGFLCATAGFHEDGLAVPEDLRYAEPAATELGLDWVRVVWNTDTAAAALGEYIPLVDDINGIKVQPSCGIGIGRREFSSGHPQRELSLQRFSNC